jgi:lysophospholipase L1-like esterase
MITTPGATTVLCFGDSNTNGIPSDDPEYVRLAADVRWTGQLQNLLGAGYYVIEEGLGGRTINLDYADRPGLNATSYILPCLLTHAPLDVVVLMLGTNDLKIEFDRTADEIADSWHGLLDILFTVLEHPEVFLVSPIRLESAVPPNFDDAAVEKSRQLSAAYRTVAEDRGLHFLDTATCAVAGADGIHLTIESHQRLAQMLHHAITSAG